MNQHYHISLEDLLVKYLLQEASPRERHTVDQWLAASAANRQHFDQLKLIWEKSRHAGPGSSLPRIDNSLPEIGSILPDSIRETQGEEEQAWQALKEKLHQPAHRKTRRASIHTLRWTAVAAAAVAALIWWRSTRVTWQEIASNDTIRIDTLADGSVITLNKHSSLSQPSTFAANQRTVSLEGEAFFQIAADKNRPFHVRTNGIAITVLGTAFNVRSENQKTVIVVESGLIEVKNRQNSIHVGAGETITLGQNDSTLQTKSVIPPIYHYYHPRDFVCRETPLGDLVDALNQAYGDSIRIADPAMRKLPITTTFHNEALPTILDVIEKTLNLTVTYTGSHYTLK